MPAGIPQLARTRCDESTCPRCGEDGERDSDWTVDVCGTCDMGQPRSLELLERRGAAVVRRVRIVYYLSASCSASRREGGSSACVHHSFIKRSPVVHLAAPTRSAPRPAPAPARSTVLAVNAQDLALGDRASAPRRPRRNAHEVAPARRRPGRRGGGPAGAQSGPAVAVRGTRHTATLIHRSASPSSRCVGARLKFLGLSYNCT